MFTFAEWTISVFYWTISFVLTYLKNYLCYYKSFISSHIKVKQQSRYYFIAGMGIIFKTSRGVPSPQLYEYKTEKLQKPEQLERDGKINLYFADESHVCNEGYVLYGCSSVTTYDGFCTTESINVERSLNFLIHSRSRLIKGYIRCSW